MRNVSLWIDHSLESTDKKTTGSWHLSDADIDRLGDSLCRNVAAQAAQAAQVSQPQPVHWMVKVERRPEKKFLLGFKMPKQAAPVMQGANCTLANIISTTLCNTIQLQWKICSFCSFLHYNPDQNYEEEIISFFLLVFFAHCTKLGPLIYLSFSVKLFPSIMILQW